jgi:hypothetical protein
VGARKIEEVLRRTWNENLRLMNGENMKLTILLGLILSSATSSAAITEQFRYVCDSVDLVNNQLILGGITSIEISADGLTAQIYITELMSKRKIPTYQLNNKGSYGDKDMYWTNVSENLQVSFTPTRNKKAGILAYISPTPSESGQLNGQKFICEME